MIIINNKIRKKSNKNLGILTKLESEKLTVRLITLLCSSIIKNKKLISYNN